MNGFIKKGHHSKESKLKTFRIFSKIYERRERWTDFFYLLRCINNMENIKISISQTMLSCIANSGMCIRSCSSIIHNKS